MKYDVYVLQAIVSNVYKYCYNTVKNKRCLYSLTLYIVRRYLNLS